MAINAKIGEISRPPRFGIRRRNGASTGSVICPTNSAPGLRLPGATHDRITLMIIDQKMIFKNSEKIPINAHGSNSSVVAW